MASRARSGATILAVAIGILSVVGSGGTVQPAMAAREIPSGIPPDIQKQIERLHSKNPARRASAARALGAMGVKAAPAIPFLIELLDDREVAKSLGDKIWDALSPLGGSGVGVWDEARRALVRIGTPSTEPLIEALREPRSRIRRHAALTLGDLRNPRAVHPLIETLKDEDWEVRMWSAKSLGEIGNREAVQPLLLALGDDEPNVRQYATTALGAIRDWRAVKPLIEELKRSPKNPWAAVALFEITGQRLGEDPRKWEEWWSRDGAAHEKSRSGE